MTRPGLPTTKACAGTSRVTTAPAPTNAYSPMVVRQTTTTPAQGRAPGHRRRVQLGAVLLDERARSEVVGEDHAGAEEHVVLDRDAVEDHHLVLDGHAVADSRSTFDVRTVADVAVAPDHRAGRTWANAQTGCPTPRTRFRTVRCRARTRPPACAPLVQLTLAVPSVAPSPDRAPHRKHDRPGRSASSPATLSRQGPRRMSISTSKISPAARLPRG